MCVVNVCDVVDGDDVCVCVVSDVCVCECECDGVVGWKCDVLG